MKCVETFDGKEYWIEDDRAEKLTSLLTLNNPPKFVDLNGSMVNVNNISGVNDEMDMKEKEFRKQGMFKCEYMFWHSRGSKCYCRDNWRNYRDFGMPKACKSKQLLTLEAQHGSLEKNIGNDGYPAFGTLTINSNRDENHSIATDLLRTFLN